MDRGRGREMERWTDRETDRQRDSETQRQGDRERKRKDVYERFPDRCNQRTLMRQSRTTDECRLVRKIQNQGKYLEKGTVNGSLS